MKLDRFEIVFLVAFILYAWAQWHYGFGGGYGRYNDAAYDMYDVE